MSSHAEPRCTVAIGVALLAAIDGGCSYTPTAPAPFALQTTQVLTGSVYPDGTTTMWLTTRESGTLSITLTSTEPGPVALGLALGILAGGHCEQREHVNARPDSVPQIAASTETGTYCVEVSDLGSVTQSGVKYSLQVLLQ